MRSQDTSADGIDSDRLELLERQLADRVTERIRPALFRLYATVGAAVIAVLGFVGWDIVTDIKTEAIYQVTRDLDAEIKPQRDEINRLLVESKTLAKQVGKVISDVERQLEKFEPKAAQLEQTILDIGNLEAESKDLDVAWMTGKRRPVLHARDGAVAFQDFVVIYERDIKPALQNIDTLSSELGELAKQVEELNAIAPSRMPPNPNTPIQSKAQRGESIKSIIQTTSVAQKDYNVVRKRTTVFLQFAGARQRARQLSDALKENGYIVPGEDQETGARNKQEVRYFHDEDAEGAKRLAEGTTRALRAQGYSENDVPNVTVRSLTAYRGKKPREGVLELWLDISRR